MARKQTQQKRKTSFALYIAGAFVLTAIMTVLITAGAVLVAWHMRRGNIMVDEDLYIVLAIAAVIALALSVVLGLLVASSIGRPLQRIVKTVSAIKEGNLSARTGLVGEDDLALLGQSFDEMADSIERDRDLERQLIGDVAHELRTPLMAIQATVEAIQDGVFPADEEHLNTISSETRRLGRLVEALLHLNRLENGTIVAKAEPVNLSEVVENLVITHEALVEASGMTFAAHIAPDVLIIGDQDLISQAVANLLSNAVRYTHEGGSIAITLARVNGNASISVSDTGIGISEEDMDKVFSRFWRADAARSTAGGGLGIGLALVKEVVDQHRGHVSVVSALGEGSTFTINVPLAADDISQINPSELKARERKAAKAAKREEDRKRREHEKRRRDEERQRKARDRQLKATLKGTRKSPEKPAQQLTLFGIRVPLPVKKDESDKEE